MQKVDRNPDEHLAAFPDGDRDTMLALDRLISAVGLARQKNHYSLYVNAIEDGTYLIASYADRLGKVKPGASSIGFKTLDNIDLDVLGELLRRANELTLEDS